MTRQGHREGDNAKADEQSCNDSVPTNAVDLSSLLLLLSSLFAINSFR